MPAARVASPGLAFMLPFRLMHGRAPQADRHGALLLEARRGLEKPA